MAASSVSMSWGRALLVAHWKPLPMDACDPKSFKLRLPCVLIREAVMIQIRRRRFLIAATNALALTIPLSILVRADQVIE